MSRGSNKYQSVKDAMLQAFPGIPRWEAKYSDLPLPDELKDLARDNTGYQLQDCPFCHLQTKVHVFLRTFKGAGIIGTGTAYRCADCNAEFFVSKRDQNMPLVDRMIKEAKTRVDEFEIK